MKFKAEFKFDNSQVGIKHYIAENHITAIRKFYHDINTDKLPYDCLLLSMKEVRNV